MFMNDGLEFRSGAADGLSICGYRASKKIREREKMGIVWNLDDCPRPKKERAIFRINRFNNLFQTIICYKLISYL